MTPETQIFPDQTEKNIVGEKPAKPRIDQLPGKNPKAPDGMRAEAASFELVRRTHDNVAHAIPELIK